MNAQEMKPIDYAKAAADTMMRRYDAPKLPPEGRFHYHQGVFLSGVYQTWLLCGNDAYFTYIKDWMDSVLDADGRILHRSEVSLDDTQPGILLFPLYQRCGEVKYKRALDFLMSLMETYPKNAEGGFWHKDVRPNQMWLDGLYMGGPICAEYGARFNRPDLIDTVAEQALLMEQKTRDPRTGLMYHAYDCDRKAPWADPETGLSHEFWGRSIGWVPVGVLDDLDFVPSQHPRREALELLVKRLLMALCKFQSSDGRWYQVVDKGGQEGNWLENSCSCLYVAALCKAVRVGLLDAEYLKAAQRGFEGVIRSLSWSGEDIEIGGVCIGTGVGDYAHYCERPVSVNDLHGVGAFLLMCAEAQRSLA